MSKKTNRKLSGDYDSMDDYLRSINTERFEPNVSEIEGFGKHMYKGQKAKGKIYGGQNGACK